MLILVFLRIVEEQKFSLVYRSLVVEVLERTVAR